MSACPFCERIRLAEYDAEHPGYSFEPLNPVTPGHRLFVPARHVADAAEDPATTAETYRAAAEYAGRQGRPFNLITAAGTAATQTVYHLHVHYVPRSEGDGLHLPWTDRRRAFRTPLETPCPR